MVQKSIHREFLDKYVGRASRLRVGDPKDPQTQIGAIASAEQMEKVKSYIELGKAEGAEVACGGQTPKGAPAKGLFLEPTVFDRVQNKMRIAQEEIFGPVVSLIEFDSLDDAISLANDVSYGLASAIYTRDIRKAHYVIDNLRAGTVWVNTYGRLFHEAPFGGYKASGLGRELGTHAIDLYTEVKTVHMDTSAEPPLRWFG
jgi:acyl-CoA reductase-like NAD-dependent aldehyde dehydrogenase